MMHLIRHVIFALLLGAGVNASSETTVRIATLEELAIYPERTAPATVVSLNETEVSAQIPARIEEMLARVGDVAEKDQVLARMECSDFSLATRQSAAQLAAMDARIELAEQRLARTEKLARTQTASEELLDERQADIAVLRADRKAAVAELEMKRLNEARCAVRSPFRAVVAERLGSVGQYAEVGVPLFRVVDLDALEVSAQVTSRDATMLPETDELHFVAEGRRMPVRLRTIVPAVNTETRNREVRLLFEDTRGMPGVAGKLAWRDRRPHVPGDLVVRRDGELGIFIANSSTARFVPLPDAQAGRASPVALPLDTKLVIEGQFGLVDGATVSTAP